MPTTVKGVVIPDEDNNYNIYINNCLNYESQLSTLKHELTHIKYNHFDSNKHVVLLEKETE